MPVCKNCSSRFPYRITIDGKLRNLQHRKYCFACSPFGLHNTRQLIHQPRSIGSPQIVHCAKCNREYEYIHSKGHGRSICNSCHVNARRFRVKRQAIEYKGGVCVSCGYSRCTAALVFHHVVPAKKEFNFGGKHALSWLRLKKELDKCILLCMNCHAERHAGFVTEARGIE